MQQIQSMHSGDIVVMNGKLLVCGVEFCDCERILREYENDSIMVLKRAGGESILVYRNGSANAGLVYQEIDLISTDCLSYIGRRTEKSGEEVWDYVYGSTVRTFASVRVVKSVDRMNCAYGAISVDSGVGCAAAIHLVSVARVEVVGRCARRDRRRGIVVEDEGLAGVLAEINDDIGPLRELDQYLHVRLLNVGLTARERVVEIEKEVLRHVPL